MKPRRTWLIAAIATAGFALTMTPAHATDVSAAPSNPIIVKPDPWEKIKPPRLPRPDPCPVRPTPPGMMVPLYCQIVPSPVVPIRPPREIIDPIMPGPILPEPIVSSDPVPMSDDTADATLASARLPGPWPMPYPPHPPYPSPFPGPIPGPGPWPGPSPWPKPWPEFPVDIIQVASFELPESSTVGDPDTDEPTQAA